VRIVWVYGDFSATCTCRHNLGALSCNHCCHKKDINVTYSDCVFVFLVIHHAKLMGHITCVACPTVTFLPALRHKGTILKNKKLLNIKCVFSFSLQLLSEAFLILRIIQRDIIIIVHRSPCKLPVILIRF
jgi:hypothetical protein